TDEMGQELAATYPGIEGKCVTITNGFDDDIVAKAGESAAREKALDMTPNRGGVEISHFGSVYGERNPARLLRATSELLQEQRIRPSDLRLRFVGAWDVVDEECESLARRLEGHGVLRRETPVSRDRCVEEMSRSRCLLALQGGYPLQIPAKLYEYIASGRP